MSEEHSDFSNEMLNDEFSPLTPEAKEAVVAALKKIQQRPFSQRHAELGKMIKCQVCGLRHRSSQVCQQKFKELYIEEDLETGEKTTIYATAPTTRNGILGAARFKGKRLKPRGNKRGLQ